MKRPHRRAHLLLWLILTPATVIAGYIAWSQRPAIPYSDIPDAIETIDQEN